MQIVASLPAGTPLSEVAGVARRVETLGFDVLHVPETTNDPFVSAALAIEHTERLAVRTSMVVAFPRSPMVTAYSAWDLARFSGGRFQLGLASQVRGNIVGRYSTPWVDPVSQLRDYVAAVRAIFDSFQHGTPLDHQGPHHRFDRLQPYFNPGPLDCAAPTIWTGGVNRRMTELGGEVADGFVCHPTASQPAYLETHVRPALEAGVGRVGRMDGGPLLVVNARPITGRTVDDVRRARDRQREELAFLYSTPAYRTQLELIGLGDLGARLSAMAASGSWTGLADHLTDDVVDQLLPSGTYAELPGVLERWYAGRCDGLVLTLPPDTRDDDALSELVARARKVRASRDGR